jgi:MYXO-CTERM domain-containing protein
VRRLVELAGARGSTRRSARTIDVAPTILALLNVEAPDTVEGTPIKLRDLSGCATGDSGGGTGTGSFALFALVMAAASARRRRNARNEQ